VNAIHIDRLHFKGRDSQRQVVVADLERAAWPCLRDREYLFIRQLHTHKPAGQLADSLAEQAQACRDAAVSGWQENADRQQAVYFADYAELLACLSRDLLRNKRCWYWRQWDVLFQLPVETALSGCWQQQQHLIPALIAQLARHDQLRWFCLQLTDTLIEQLCRVVCPQWDELKQCESLSGAFQAGLSVPPHWLAPWHAVLAGADLPLQVMQLAALIALREWQPLKRQAAEMLPVYRAVLQQLMVIGSSQPETVGRNEYLVRAEQNTTIMRSAAANKPAKVIDAGVDSDSLKPAMPADMPSRSRSAETGMPTEQTEQKKSGSMAEPVLGPPVQPVSDLIAERTAPFPPPACQLDPVPDSGCSYPSRLLTQQGGIFYLLNFLNLPGVQACLCSEPQTRDYPSAWGWLWQLAVAMEWAAEPGLERLFAFFCGYATPEQLRQLPAMPRMHALLHWGRQRYGVSLFNRDIFAIPGLIEIDACHVDVFYALDSVNPDVRRAGLDIDPGWLPWLGKVVKFHYGELPLI
jgi:hypothetical protein